MKTFLIRFASVLLLSSFAFSANAATLVGTFLDDNAWTLIHGGSGPAPTTDGGSHLRWDPGQSVVFDLTGSTLSAAGPQDFNLASNDGMAAATFTLLSASMDLSGPDGFTLGTLDYSLNVSGGPLDGSYTGQFTFAAMNVSGFPFNSSTNNGSTFELYLWGGDDANNLGIDIGLSAPVPVPAPLLLFASGLLGLGLKRRRSQV